MKEIEKLATKYAEYTGVINNPVNQSQLKEAFIAGAKSQSMSEWVQLPTKELLKYGYYAIRIEHNGFVDIKFEFIDNQIIPYHYATHYCLIVLPFPPQTSK